METVLEIDSTTKANNIFNCWCCHFYYDLHWYFYFYFDFDCNCNYNCNWDFDFNMNWWYWIKDGRFLFDCNGIRLVVINLSHQLYHSCLENIIETKKPVLGDAFRATLTFYLQKYQINWSINWYFLNLCTLYCMYNLYQNYIQNLHKCSKKMCYFAQIFQWH